MNGNNEIKACGGELGEQEKFTIKYKFIREKIILHFNKGCRILRISKITAAVIFLIFTFSGIVLGNKSGHQLQWLQAWVLLIFFYVAVFIIAEYCKYLIESRVIPYLEDDERIEFGEYDIFVEDIDNPDDDEEDEEEDEED